MYLGNYVDFSIPLDMSVSHNDFCFRSANQNTVKDISWHFQ